MTPSPYEEILKRAQTELSREEQIKLSTQLSTLPSGKERRSITELEGLGKEIWKEVDPDEYVARERDSWD